MLEMGFISGVRSSDYATNKQRWWMNKANKIIKWYGIGIGT